MTENTSATSAHAWQAATTPIRTFNPGEGVEKPQDMLRYTARDNTNLMQAAATGRADVITVNCARCMRLFEDAENEPCIPVPMP
ncbi:hypothetical protein [Nonomuraea sp. NPDC023979]|uniref:hypothetical protein n=1 Tax=Nonomuraea sp. NPDC023979 TaxID=3154796 RepID=UPI0033CF9741